MNIEQIENTLDYIYRKYKGKMHGNKKSVYVINSYYYLYNQIPYSHKYFTFFSELIRESYFAVLEDNVLYIDIIDYDIFNLVNKSLLRIFLNKKVNNKYSEFNNKNVKYKILSEYHSIHNRNNLEIIIENKLNIKPLVNNEK
jgi:hypothetical protein